MNKFALCVNSGGYDDIQKWKIYEVVKPNEASDKGWLRIVDDSGEDYLYPPNYFEFIDLPIKIQQAIIAEKTLPKT